MQPAKPRRPGRPPKPLHSPAERISLQSVPVTEEASINRLLKRQGTYSLPELFSPNQAGAAIGLTGEAVKQWIYKHRLPAQKSNNGYWRIRREDLMRFLQLRMLPEVPLVLIVDDDPDFDATLERALTAAGYRAMYCHDAVDAALKAKNDTPSLLVVNMSLDQGWLALAGIRGQHQAWAVPIIFFSQKVPTEAEMARMMRVGGQGYLRKSAGLDQMVRQVRDVLGGGLIEDAAHSV